MLSFPKNTRNFAATALAAIAFVTQSGYGQMLTLVDHQFDGPGGDLDGTDIVAEGGVFNSDINAVGGSGVWAAAAGFSDSGMVDVTSKSAFLGLGSYINDAKGTGSGKFELTMTVSETSGAWLSLGFSTFSAPNGGGTIGNSFTSNNPNGIGTIIYRSDGELDMFTGPRNQGAVDGPDANSGDRTLTVTIDVTPEGGYNGVDNFGTVTWSDSALGMLDNLEAAFALPDESIGGVLVSAATSSSGTISALKLSQIIDSSPPSLVSQSPHNIATNVVTVSDLVLTFDKDVQAGNGSISIIEVSSGSVVESFDVASSSQLTFNGKSLTIDPSDSFGLGLEYEVIIPSGAITDLGGGEFVGVATGEWTFTSIGVDAILVENFTGTGGALDGTSAELFETAITSAGGSPLWSASSFFSEDGSVNGSANQGSASLNLGSFINDAAGPSAGKFVLTATLSETAGEWLSLGFAVENTPGTGRNFTGFGTGDPTSGVATVIRREVDDWDLDMFSGPALTGATIDGPEPTESGPRTLTVCLDLTPVGGYDGTTNFGSVTWFDSVLGEIGTHTYASEQSFGSILISRANDSSGTVSSLRLVQEEVSGNDFSNWIAGFPGVGSLSGFGDDADGDGISNGLEAFFGTDPSTGSAGLSQVQTIGSETTFQHPQSESQLDDVTGTYEWSFDLQTWNTLGETVNGTTVSIPEPLFPVAGVTSVTATVSGFTPDQLYFRVVAKN